jgi:uncharacterized protein
MKMAHGFGMAFAMAVVGMVSPGLRAQDRGALLVRLEGVLLPQSRVVAILVDESVTEPPTAAIALRAGSVPPAVGRGIDIAAIDGQILFQGEVVASEQLVQASGEPIVIVRALDRLHRLNRGKKTREFRDASDADIARQLAFSAGLQAKAAGPEASTPHSTVHQHEQTDLEFLRERAAAIGYHVFTDRTTLHFEKRRLVPQTIVGCTLRVIRVRALAAWLASPDEVHEVQVRGWDPVKKEEIVGKARQDAIGLSRAASHIEPPASILDLGFVETLQSAMAAHAVAKGVLSQSTEQDLSAEMAVDGDAALRARAEIILEGAGAAFNGKYFVQGVSHRYDRGPGGGWKTLLRVVREDRSVFLLPEVGDEVLVAFQHGDVDRPVIVGSLWTSQAPPETSPCQ